MTVFVDYLSRLYLDGRYYLDVNMFPNSIIDNLESCRRNEEERENSSVSILDVTGFMSDSCTLSGDY
ncbi:MAG: hypothetical protein PHN69_00425 [Candidatus Pacebacteria bacterium]|nr:hypothetical protein [Candidatus Paceibacterota bacterium]